MTLYVSIDSWWYVVTHQGKELCRDMFLNDAICRALQILGGMK